MCAGWGRAAWPPPRRMPAWRSGSCPRRLTAAAALPQQQRAARRQQPCQGARTWPARPPPWLSRSPSGGCRATRTARTSAGCLCGQRTACLPAAASPPLPLRTMRGGRRRWLCTSLTQPPACLDSPLGTLAALAAPSRQLPSRSSRTKASSAAQWLGSPPRRGRAGPRCWLPRSPAGSCGSWSCAGRRQTPEHTAAPMADWLLEPASALPPAPLPFPCSLTAPLAPPTAMEACPTLVAPPLSLSSLPSCVCKSQRMSPHCWPLAFCPPSPGPLVFSPPLFLTPARAGLLAQPHSFHNPLPPSSDAGISFTSPVTAAQLIK